VRLWPILVVLACNPSEPPPPPEVCRPAQSAPAFVEVTGEWGLSAIIGTAVRAADLDGDGYPDLMAGVATDATRSTMTRFLLLNNKGAGFTDATAASGILATSDGAGGRSIGVVNFGDLDNDGDTDLVACPSSKAAPDPCAAFLNDGKAHFTLAPESLLGGVGAFQCDSMALLDFDRDGKLDLWPGTYATHPWLFKGIGDGTFDELGWMYGLPQNDGDPTISQSWRRVFGVTACDLDDDGDQDVMLAGYGRELNQVWRWDGDHFTEVGVALGLAADDRLDYSDDLSYRCYCAENPGTCPAGVPAPPAGYCPGRGWVPGESDAPWRLAGNTFSLGCGDVDNDGDMDVMTAEIRHWDVGSAADPSELCLNPGGGGKFVRPGATALGMERNEIGGWNEGDMMPVFADVDLDGNQDIYLTSSDYPNDHGWLWRNKGDGTFEDVTAAWNAGHRQIHGVALVDLDLDGDLDLVAGTSTARGVAATMALRVYRNELAGGNFLRITLSGSTANRSAVGARVRVKAGGRTQTQEVSGGYGHVSIQNDLALTFGLGSACSAEEVEVRWPDAQNTVERFRDVRGNYRVHIAQGGKLTYVK
jgi:enediyne biosynthesis protein E4